MQAAEEGFTDVVELLVAQGADVGATDKDGDSIFGIAKHRGHTRLADFLLANGATDSDKPTSRELADREGSPDILGMAMKR
jgi:ankyrin repeat protein